MVVDSKAKMSVALFKGIFISLVILELSNVVSGQNELPESGECGTLKTDYFYNQKRKTEIDEFPWMGRVLFKNKTDNTFWFKCYAVLISKRFLLLRAKCFDVEEEPVSVELGDWNLANDKRRSDCDDNGRCAPVPREYDIQEIIIHPNYSSKSSQNNIALVEISKPVTYSDFIRPICLPSRDVFNMNFPNQLLEVTGWYLNESVSQTLAKSFARVVTLKTCVEKMRHFTVDIETNICAYTCSNYYVYSLGSALMDIKTVDDKPGFYFLIGLNLHGLGTCSLLYPDVYIRVDRYLDWIYANIL